MISSVDSLPAKGNYISTGPVLKSIVRKALGYRKLTWNPLVSNTGLSILVKSVWIPK
jgi:hypothetical protein